MSLGREERGGEGYHPISSSSFTFFTSSSPLLSHPTHLHPFKKLPYDCVHYANEWLTAVMASGEGKWRGMEKERRQR
jgi:hypothetical protein